MSKRRFIPEDILEFSVLPRLPVKSLVRFKCVSKKWYDLISNNQNFVLRQFQNCTSRQSLNFGVRGRESIEWYTSIHRDGSSVCFGDLLPCMKGYIIASCNGLAIMSCTIEQVRYSARWNRNEVFVGNPLYKDWKWIPMPVESGVFYSNIGLAFDPVRSVTHYELVYPYRRLMDQDYSEYGFKVFSSEMHKWKVSESTFSIKRSSCRIFPTPASLSGILYWITGDDHVLWYNTNNDSCGLVPLPICRQRRSTRVTLNESNGSINYTRIVHDHEIELWSMKGLQWSKMHHIMILEIVQRKPEIFGHHMESRSKWAGICDAMRRSHVYLLGFDGKEAFFMINKIFYGYDIETGQIMRYMAISSHPCSLFFYKASLFPTPGQQQQQFPPSWKRLKLELERYACFECGPGVVLDIKVPGPT